MPNDKYRILSTRHLTDSSIAVAGESGIHIDVKDFIQIKLVLNEALMGEENLFHVFRPEAVHVFTSVNAVKMLAQHYIHQDDTFYVVSKPKICCISGKTKKALQRLFKSGEFLAESPYGSELGTTIAALGNITAVNFFCGNIRRNELPDILKEAGITVNEFVIYENIPAPVVTATNYDGILFFSPSAVKSYFSVNQLPAATVCFAIGSTTAAALKEYTENKIIMSTNISEDDMVQTAIFYFNNINCYE
ncbi:uroporphyrinogen-III synthase [Chitinophaga arvensicola]|uniref:Uroporphyrinogen-III synthase n=1 Tax=Chitinophaga arvensicola TaxID=29529 RepID=A0A1I0SCH4_9BACT|nr:uroporphyrinogen-III synthase [Chitinophaga arvensicola]SEW54580.1 uroporphyrinogen-III synthase [Chitinophaga arvensicola]